MHDSFRVCKSIIAIKLSKIQLLACLLMFYSCTRPCYSLYYSLIGSLQVKDLEVEFETAKQKNKETMQQAILIERERLTQMQWDMEELRRKSLEMELKLKSKEVTY